jgi:hypothetical protein
MNSFSISHLTLVNRRFNLEVQHNTFEKYSLPSDSNCLPQSGSVSQPRVAASATLGKKIEGRFNRNAVASLGATRSGLIMICTYYPKVDATLGFET